MRHTPLPWALQPEWTDLEGLTYFIVGGKARSEIAILPAGHDPDEHCISEGDGAFIVQAVNSHGELLSAATHAHTVCERVLSLNEEWLRPEDANALRGLVEHLEEVVRRVEG